MKQRVKPSKARKSRTNDEKVEPGSGNVFADLGFRDAEERLLKAKLATKIVQIDRAEGLDPSSDRRADSVGPT